MRGLFQCYYRSCFQTLQLSKRIIKTSLAPIATNRSIMSAVFFFSTMLLIATHPLSSRGEIVGARRPGVIAMA